MILEGITTSLLTTVYVEQLASALFMQAFQSACEAINCIHGDLEKTACRQCVIAFFPPLPVSSEEGCFSGYSPCIYGRVPHMPAVVGIITCV